MKTKKFNHSSRFLSVIIIILLLVSCGDNSSNNEQVSDKNVSKLKLLKDSAVVDKKDVPLNQTSKVNDLSDTISLLEQNNNMLNDSLNFYTAKLTELDIQIDDLAKKKKYFSETDKRAKSKITTNITDLESFINSLKISKSNEEKNLNMIEKRKELISMQNEALKSELEFNQIELNELYTKTDAEGQIEAVTKKINEINNKILTNKNSLIEEDLNEKLTVSKIANMDDQISIKQKQFKTEYEKSTGIKDYVESEVEDLVYQINNLEIQKTELSKKWKSFKVEKDDVLLKLQNLNNEKNELLSPIITKSISVNSNNELIASNTNKIEKEEGLSNNQSLIEESENSTEGSGSFIYWFVLIIILIIVALYLLGKKNNSTKDLGEENE